ncbi:MAG: BamA/TamA family outer membrane protein [Gammaproteobacteria bacterium]
MSRIDVTSPSRCPTATAIGLLAGLAAGACATGAGAQYFGGNKVRYENPEFRVLASEHFDVYTYPEADAGAAEAAVLMERWYRRLEDALDHELKGRQPLILYAGHPQFRQTNATPGEIGEGTGGFTELFKRRIVLPLAGTGADSDHVLGHELVHAYQFDVARKLAEDPSGKVKRASALSLPLWFIEGMAEYLSLGSDDTHTAMWMRDAIWHKDLPTLERLNSPKYFPYRYGHAFWAYVAGRFGDAAVPRLLRTACATGDVLSAVRKELKIDAKQLSKDWHEALTQEFGPAVASAHDAKDYGRVLIRAKRGKGSINLSPVLSPDGKKLLFFSERSLFSIELYVADVETGEVLRSITRSVTDPHIDSLQFLQSSGTWSPDSKRVAIGGVGAGRPILTIVDAESGDTIEEHRFDKFAEVLHPAWSPDGKSIAFAGNVGGVLNLQLFDLESKTLRALTTGPAAAMQPAWSPDGRQLAFVTDRFTSDFKQLGYGDFRIARLDLASGAVTPVPGLEDGTNSNPQWSPDGNSVYFLSGARGGKDLYRADLATGAIEVLTELITGITGIAKLSPALSIASQGPLRVAGSVYSKGMYAIYLFDKLQPRPVTAKPDPSAPRPGQLPPRQRVEPRIDRLLAERVPAVEDVKVEAREVKRGLSVDYATQVSAGVGTSTTAGSVYGGGLALYWSDMLGDHNLLTAFQAEGTSETITRNLSALLAYENREHRLRWGGALGQVPSVSVAYGSEANCQFEPGFPCDYLIRQWTINRELAGRLAYPLTRSDRVEASLGYRHISYYQDALVNVYDPGSGLVIGTGTVELSAPDSIEIYPIGLAYVHDTSVFGGTAPVLGNRYRLELGGTVGSLDFYSPLIDYRQYYRPFEYLSLGGRFMHYGRYGRDAEDQRLGQVYIGNWTLVRGYNYSSFGLDECDDPTGQTCPVFDQLFGSRMALASAEARVPVFGALGLVRTPAVPPIDIAAFYDAGVAWTRDIEPSFLGGDRDLVRSYGASIRLNFFGALVLQWSYVNPLDRPNQDWYWEFIIAPGF